MASDVHVIRIPAGGFAVNTYLVACAGTAKAVVIDPAGEAGSLMAAIAAEHLEVLFILNTHGHADHVEANRALKARLGVPVCMHAADDAFFSDPRNRRLAERELGLPCPDPADIVLADGQVLTVGHLSMTVLHTPGHTPGSVCYQVGKHLFTGDTLFVGDAGRTDLAGGSLETLIHSIETRILPLPGDTVVWPGHDYGDTPSSTLAQEIRENPYITDFIQLP